MECKLREAIESSPTEFLEAAAKLGLKSSKRHLKALIWSVDPSSEVASSLPSVLHGRISSSVASFIHHSNSKKTRRSTRRQEEDKKIKKTLEELQILAMVTGLCVSNPSGAFIPLGLLPPVRTLHDNMLHFESDTSLLSSISSICFEWWRKDFPCRESLITQSLPFILSISLTFCRKCEVKKVYSMREAFGLLDFEDESIGDVRVLLLRCLVTPWYMKMEEGRRFVAFVVGLSGGLLREALEVMRSQIRFGRKSVLEAYSYIVFTAWRIGGLHSIDVVENSFLQVLIHGAVHAASGSLASSVRRVLGGFVCRRTAPGVEKLLFRLAQPLIFRSLQVANSNVRLNALHLLLDLFPLEDPETTKDVKDAFMDKQFFLLQKLLTDNCPDVRVVAVEGSCRILRLFWEIIPPSTITKIAAKIFDEMSHDSSSEVRLSTLNGIIYLLGNPQSHQLLKVLLPRFGHLVSDTTASVRAAVVELLLAIRDIKTFQFHKVVGLETLLSILANDQPHVAQKITRLLIPSYFPSKIPIEEACNRCLALIKRSPMGGARFCDLAFLGGASPDSLMDLTSFLINSAFSSRKLPPLQRDGIIIAVSSLSNRLCSDTAHKASLNQLLSGGTVKRLLESAASPHSLSSLFDMISRISPENGGKAFRKCMGVITDCGGLADDSEKQNAAKSAQNLVISSGRFDHMFGEIVSLLQSMALGCNLKFGTKIPNVLERFGEEGVRSRGKGLMKEVVSEFEDRYNTIVGVCWQMRYLVSECEEEVLMSEKVEVAFSSLRVIAEASVVECVDFEYMDVHPLLAYTSLALYLSLNKTHGKRTGKTDIHADGACLEILDETMDHLLLCTDKLIGSCTRGRANSYQTKRGRPKRKRGRSDADECDPTADDDDESTGKMGVVNAAKAVTGVLKFYTDGTSFLPSPLRAKKALLFASTALRFFFSLLKNPARAPEPLAGIFLCIRSSSTYSARLLRLALISSGKDPNPLSAESRNLAGHILDIAALLEPSIGSRFASALSAALRPWLPDLVLALGWDAMFGGARPETEGPDLDFWVSAVISRDFEFSEFGKLVEVMVKLVRKNVKLVEAIGVVFSDAAWVGLRRRDFEILSGAVNFVCSKLLGGEWSRPGRMMDSLEELYCEIEKVCEEERSVVLEEARDILEPLLRRARLATTSRPVI